MNKLWYINSLQYHTAMKMNKLELRTTGMNLKNTTLNKERKLGKNTLILLTKMSKPSKVNNALSRESNLWKSKLWSWKTKFKKREYRQVRETKETSGFVYLVIFFLVIQAFAVSGFFRAYGWFTVSFLFYSISNKKQLGKK